MSDDDKSIINRDGLERDVLAAGFVVLPEREKAGKIAVRWHTVLTAAQPERALKEEKASW